MYRANEYETKNEENLSSKMAISGVKKIIDNLSPEEKQQRIMDVLARQEKSN